MLPRMTPAFENRWSFCVAVLMLVKCSDGLVLIELEKDLKASFY